MSSAPTRQHLAEYSVLSLTVCQVGLWVSGKHYFSCLILRSLLSQNSVCLVGDSGKKPGNYRALLTLLWLGAVGVHRGTLSSLVSLGFWEKGHLAKQDPKDKRVEASKLGQKSNPVSVEDAQAFVQVSVL